MSPHPNYCGDASGQAWLMFSSKGASPSGKDAARRKSHIGWGFFSSRNFVFPERFGLTCKIDLKVQRVLIHRVPTWAQLARSHRPGTVLVHLLQLMSPHRHRYPPKSVVYMRVHYGAVPSMVSTNVYGHASPFLVSHRGSHGPTDPSHLRSLSSGLTAHVLLVLTDGPPSGCTTAGSPIHPPKKSRVASKFWHL